MQQEIYKLINGTPVKYMGQAIIKDGIVYSNPSREILKSEGYLPMGQNDIPDFDPEKEYVTIGYYSVSEDGEEIITHYVITTEDFPIFETDVKPTLEERIAVLESALLEIGSLLGGD